jgi:arylsulfatase A-like enzyme/Tfp pilus assembly protein PilF
LIRRRSILFAAALLLLSACARTAEAPQRERFPIFIISIDTLRADRTGPYGYSGASTPVLNAFRKESVLFERAFSHCPMTLPSHSTLFTGLLPPVAGVRDNLGYRVPENVPTLPQILKDAGYSTGAAVSTFVLRRATGIARGFDAYDDAMEGERNEALTFAERNGDRTREIFERWLATTSTQSVFGFLHIYEPHAPYKPPPEYASGDPYDGEVTYADAIVGRFFDALRKRGLYDNALIVVMSDHGEGLGDHGEEHHGVFVYRESIQVPLIVKLPRGEKANTTVSQPVGLFDVAPTILAAAGIDQPAGMKGVNVLGTATQSRQIYSETYYPRLHLGWSEVRSMIGERHHYIDAPRRELYDYVADAREVNNILSQQRRTTAAMSAALAAIPAAFELPSAVDPEEQRKLAALGYVGNTVASGGVLPDPKDNIQFVRMFARANGIADAGRHREAIQLLRELTQDNPSMVDAWALLALEYRRTGQKERELEALRTAMARFPQNPHVALAMADALFVRGDYDGARQHALLAARSSPTAAYEALAEMALRRDDLTTAEQSAVRALQESPDRTASLRLLARVRRRQHRFADELTLLDRAAEQVRLRSLDAIEGLQYDRGNVLLELQRAAEAEQAFALEVRAFPDNVRAWANLAIIQAAKGDTAAAQATIEAMLKHRSDPESRRVAQEVRGIMSGQRR